MMQQRQKGMSLVEILVVVAIILLLVSITAVLMGPALAKSKTYASCAGNLKQRVLAFNMYSTDNEGYPPPSLAFDLYFKNKIPSKCPLNGIGYYDTYQRGFWDNLHRRSEHFTDGSLIPKFDPTFDVLFRCYSHSYNGFDGQKEGGMIVIDANTRGKVLGARMDGSVGKVFFMSCFELSHMSPHSLKAYEIAQSQCDGKERF